MRLSLKSTQEGVNPKAINKTFCRRGYPKQDNKQIDEVPKQPEKHRLKMIYFIPDKLVKIRKLDNTKCCWGVGMQPFYRPCSMASANEMSSQSTIQPFQSWAQFPKKLSYVSQEAHSPLCVGGEMETIQVLITEGVEREHSTAVRINKLNIHTEPGKDRYHKLLSKNIN